MNLIGKLGNALMWSVLVVFACTMILAIALGPFAIIGWVAVKIVEMLTGGA